MAFEARSPLTAFDPGKSGEMSSADVEGQVLVCECHGFGGDV